MCSQHSHHQCALNTPDTFVLHSRHFLSYTPDISCPTFPTFLVLHSRHFLSYTPDTPCPTLPTFLVLHSRHFLSYTSQHLYSRLPSRIVVVKLSRSRRPLLPPTTQAVMVQAAPWQVDAAQWAAPLCRVSQAALCLLTVWVVVALPYLPYQLVLRAISHQTSHRPSTHTSSGTTFHARPRLAG